MSRRSAAGSFDPGQYWESRLTGPSGFATVGHRVLGEPFNRWAYRVRRRVFLRTLRGVLGPDGPGDVLDVGSGTGFYIERWRELGADSVTGSDLSAAAVASLGERFPGSAFLRLDIGGDVVPELTGRFDTVSAVDVLFHIVDDESYRRAFHNLAALLKPGGLLVFSEFFVRGEPSRGVRWVKRASVETQSAMRAAGLEPLVRRPLFFLMNDPADARRTVHRRAWRALVKALRARPNLGLALGACLYPLEIAIGGVRSDGPSTQLVVCRKRA